MRYAILTIAALVLLMGCAENVTGPETDNGTDQTRTILFMVTGSMKECGYFSHTDATGGSTIIRDCMVPFSVTVEVPEGVQLQVTAGKRDESGNLTVCAVENSAIIGYDTALEGDMEAQWIEGQ